MDILGNAYATGSTWSGDFPTAGGFDTTLDGGEAFVTRIGLCGDGLCGPPEVACTCGADCPAACGDGCCTTVQEECSCVADCGVDECGNGCCGAAENASNCNTLEGGDCPSDCGDGACTAGEQACAAFCNIDCLDVCGDGCCGGTEDACACPFDCGADACGNGCCGPGETACACAIDCEGTPGLCGDGCCSGGEDCSTCGNAGEDCECGPGIACDMLSIPVVCIGCGDGTCDMLGENACSCTADCAGLDLQGDGCCSGAEGACGESACPVTCGDGCCMGAENACNCTADCGAEFCGNACCGSAESCDTCPDDCGSCPDSGSGATDLGPADVTAEASRDSAIDATGNTVIDSGTESLADVETGEGEQAALDLGRDSLRVLEEVDGMVADAPANAGDTSSSGSCTCRVGRRPSRPIPAWIVLSVALSARAGRCSRARKNQARCPSNRSK